MRRTAGFSAENLAEAEGGRGQRLARTQQSLWGTHLLLHPPPTDEAFPQVEVSEAALSLRAQSTVSDPRS